jgi:hypothetical protein
MNPRNINLAAQAVYEEQMRQRRKQVIRSLVFWLLVFGMACGGYLAAEWWVNR